MALEKVNESSNSQKMKFGENRDLDKILEKSTKTKRINVDLDEDTQIRFKSACVKRNTTMKDVISDYVHQWLKQNE
ncbi:MULTISPECIES: plasmid partition protein ParG [Morganellaceae]|uniref:Plasmid partition protein ParG n=1 Tax=Proteus genomosp. 6 TaxID=1311820 RepID=A0ABV1LE97_9GAMM|nr:MULTISPECIES: plasmid partition protein ParG [Morganellaceae]MCL8557051.1 DNA partition complex ParG [Proteus mirabilis]APC11337.1 ParG [Providencia rettgeri]ARV76006.1 ParG [Providencia rettgeri]MBT0459515.1 DNA partition complex ParG [Morganella morganii subsp. morganii]MBZ3683451.1 DNA partition complex ParG [Providencia rettgeri]